MHSDSAPVTLYGTRFCPYCVAARELLAARGVRVEDIAVDGDRAMRQRLAEASGQRTVPQIWIGARHIGGYDELSALARSGRLDALLQAAAARVSEAVDAARD
jgi:glutaredoxin 3